MHRDQVTDLFFPPFFFQSEKGEEGRAKKKKEKEKNCWQFLLIELGKMVPS